MKDKKMVISMKNNLKIELPLRYEPETNEWVLRISEEPLTDITKYFDNGWYAFDEKSTIRIV